MSFLTVQKKEDRSSYDMYPESWTLLFAVLIQAHGCFPVYNGRHPFCFGLDPFVVVVVHVFINSFGERFEGTMILFLSAMHFVLHSAKEGLHYAAAMTVAFS